MDEKKRIGISASGPDYVTISGLKSGEKGVIEASFVSGKTWVRVMGGKLMMAPAFERFPDPVKDEAMAPFWMAPGENEKYSDVQLKFFSLEKMSDYSSPSIMVKHLCGYNWSQENYEAQAEKLRAYGFEIMRSPRGKDGKFWESWYLPGLWAANGDLKTAIETAICKCKRMTDGSEKKELAAALEFLSQNVEFGALDVCVQRMAMCLPD